METQLNPQYLRIGNIIYYPEFKEHITVYGTSEDVVQFNQNSDVYYDEIDKFSPIPLTEEWLLKMGFKKSHRGKFEHDMLAYDIYGDNGLYMHGVSVEIQYVHQLQNLFYALKGQELTIKQ